MSTENAEPAAQPPRRRRWPSGLARRAPRAAENAGVAAAESAATGTDQPAGERGRPAGERGPMGLVAKISVILGLVSVTVGLVTGIVALVDRIRSDPDPVKKAELSAPRVEAGLTFRQYLERVDQDPGNLSEEVLAQRGALIRFTLEATGYRGDPLGLRYEVIDLGSHDRVLKSDAFTITPGADTDRLSPRGIFAPFPERGGPFRVYVEVFAPDGASIADAEQEFGRE